MNEPKTIRAGDSISWTESGGDHPAPTWALKYYIRGDGGKLDVTATASGSDHLVAITAANTTSLKPGIYGYQGRWEYGTNIVTPEDKVGMFEVLPNFALTPDGIDQRSHVRKVRDALQAVIEGRATKAQESIQIAGRALSYLKPAELRTEWLHYDRFVKDEERAEKMKKGMKSGKNILIRFVNP